MTHTLEVKQTDHGDLYFNIPEEVLNRLGWECGDDVEFQPVGDGSFMIKKIKRESIQLDLTQDQLFKYMLAAHELDLSFNQFVELAVKQMIQKH